MVGSDGLACILGPNRDFRDDYGHCIALCQLSFRLYVYAIGPKLITSAVTWQLNHELHKSASLETPSDVARYARSTRALLTSQAHDKTSEQRMINIMDHAISILQGPIGQQVSPTPAADLELTNRVNTQRRKEYGCCRLPSTVD